VARPVLRGKLCEALILARPIEKYGTGTQTMIRESVGHGLSEPSFALPPGKFVATVWRDWLRPEREKHEISSQILFIFVA
jgi:predicted HTH transcriptional regulator